MIDDLTESTAFNDAQKNEMRAALDDTIGRSMKNIDQLPVLAA